MGRKKETCLRQVTRNSIEEMIKENQEKICRFFNFNYKCYFTDYKRITIARFWGSHIYYNKKIYSPGIEWFVKWKGFNSISPVQLQSIIIHEIAHKKGNHNDVEYVAYCYELSEKWFGENWKEIMMYDPSTKHLNSKTF